MVNMLFQLHFPFRLICSGSSGVGKSTLIAQILKQRKDIIDQPIHKIIYCAKFETSISPLIKNDKNISFNEGLPSEELVRNEENLNLLFVVDDLFDAAYNSPVISDIFTQGRNRNIGIVLITQNLFPKFSRSRDISLNSSYYIIYRNLRDASQIKHFARQVAPRHSKEFCELYYKYIDKPFSYLFIDFSPEQEDLFRYRTDILSPTPTIFVQDDKIKTLEKFGETSETQGYIIKLQKPDSEGEENFLE